MNLKVSYFNFNYLIENIKKSRGIIFLFIFIIPIFTCLFMLLLNSAYTNGARLTTLIDISIPSLIGMYIIPFVMAVTLFNFLFKKDSVDFINGLPLKRETIYITNIIAGLGIFLLIFLITSLLMFVSSFFFKALIIPSSMYWYYFITFFITYSFVFIVSSLTLSLTGSRMAHIALTLIVLFIPGFMSDFYVSNVYNFNNNDYINPACDVYDSKCQKFEIDNQLIVGTSYKLSNGATLPYKYINMVPRAFFGIYNHESTYQAEVMSVYNASSLLRMLFLSVIYFMIGLITFVNRKMEIAESTFKSERIHQIVKCLTLFPLCLGAITLFNQEPSVTILLIMLTIIITIYVVYDLITRRNSGQFMKSVIYFLCLVLGTITIYITLHQISGFEAFKEIKKEEVSNVGIDLSHRFNNVGPNDDISILRKRITDKRIIDLIFENANRRMTSDIEGKKFAIRLGLKNGSAHYFNFTLLESEYNELLTLLDMDKDYKKAFVNIPYNDVYAVYLGGSLLDKTSSDKVIELVKEGYSDKSLSDIINSTYMGMDANEYNLSNSICAYDGSIKIYNINTSINPKLSNYVMQTSNKQYIEKVKTASININQIHISMNLNDGELDNYKYDEGVNKNRVALYRYINDNIKSDFDFSKTKLSDIVTFNIYAYNSVGRNYQIFLPKDDKFEEIFSKIKEDTNTETPIDYKGL